MTIVMGLVTNYPYAIAPGMGLNAVVFSLALGRVSRWQRPWASSSSRASPSPSSC